MTRIIFEFLLIFACGGIVFYASGEEIKENSTLVDKTDHATENISMTISNVTENAAEFTNTSTQTYSSTSFSKNSSILEKHDKANSAATENLGTEAPSIAKHGNVSTEDSPVTSSDIDYGGYNVSNESKLRDGKENTEKELIKVSLLKSEHENEFISLETKIPSTMRSEVAPNSEANSSPVANLEKHLTTLVSVTQSFPSTTEPRTDLVPSPTALYLNDETNEIEVGSSPKPSTNQQKVSASPKSSTKKRSLNTTRYDSFGDIITEPPSQSSSIALDTSSNFESTQGVKIDSTSKQSAEVELEKLPTPLSLESEDKKTKSNYIPSRTVESSEQPVQDEKNSDNLMSESSYTDENIAEKAGYASEASTMLDKNIQTREEIATTSKIVEDSDIEVTNSNDPLNENISQPSREREVITLPDNVLAHETDDIIYAGFAEDEPLGATFDPDGMKNDLPQDPDSIIFSVTPKTYSKISTEKYVDISHIHLEETSTGSSLPDILPHDAPETEFEVVGLGNSSESLPLKLNESEALVPPLIVFGKPAEYKPEDMQQDAAPIQNFNVSYSDDSTKPIETESIKETSILTSQILTKPSIATTEASKTSTSDHVIIHHTEQSVIRPVKVTSPDKDISTSVNTKVPMTQPTEFYTSSSQPLDIFDNSSSKKALKPDTSSPAILPNPAPSITEKIVENLEASTVVMQPELADSSSTRNTSLPNGYEDSSPSSTVAGVAVKTSVSVSLPLPNMNASNETQHLNGTGPFITIMNSSQTSMTNKDQNTSLSDELSTEIVTTSSTDTPSTPDAGIKIRKPGIRIPGASDAGRTRKPYTPPKPRLSTTAGPPVSIFKKARTRLGSITSSTTGAPLPKFSTIRVHYASRMPGMIPGGEMVVSVEPITTTIPPTTTTEEPISELPFTDPTVMPDLPDANDTIVVKVAGGIVLKQGIRWTDQLSNRHSPEFKDKAGQMQFHLERLFRSSPIASRLLNVEIDGFNGTKISRNVEVDFFLYLIKSPDKIAPEHLATVFHEKLHSNNTFARYRVDPSRTAFEIVHERPLLQPTPPPEDENEPPVPQWAIAVIVIFAASLIFVVLFATVTMYGRYHRRRRYGNKLSEDELDRSSGEWESKMTAAYENMAADTIYDAEDLRSDAYKKQNRIATFHGIPSTLKRCDSWSSGGWSTPPKRKKPPHVH